MEKRIFLKPGREKSVCQRHPWIYSGAIERVEGHPRLGETVEVYNAKGEWMARAAYSPHSSIRARIWNWNREETIDEDFFAKRITQAIGLRLGLIDRQTTNAFRLIHGESDGLPGLIVDQYNDWLVMQVLTAGMEVWRETVVAVLRRVTGLENIFERSDVDVRLLEGLEERMAVYSSNPPPDWVEVRENNYCFRVDIKHGQKTGFYLDQRENRRLVGTLAAGREVLNAFSYTGAFSVYALGGGARSVCSIDTSAEALERGREHIALNNLPLAATEWVEGDVFQVLRKFRDMGRKFDMIILDPPKFAHTSSQVARAARGYKDINLLGFKLLRPGGLLVTFSCSGSLSAELFQKIVADAALDAGVEGRIVMRLFQSPDHPVALNFPEGLYLKGLVVAV